MCTPLGACFAFKGLEGCIPLVHGSQGCATYIRRYMISHYREPVDIASSNFSESTAIYGGSENLKKALHNIHQQYAPEVIGVATTCLSETIGDDPSQVIRETEREGILCDVVHVSTPSYSGTHEKGYRDTCFQIVKHYAKPGIRNERVTVIPGLFSPADIRHLKQVLAGFGIDHLVVPDYSETLDGPLWQEYHKIPSGGTPRKHLDHVGSSRSCIEFGTAYPQDSISAYLQHNMGVDGYRLDYPVGIALTDRLMAVLSEITGKDVPVEHTKTRGRLLDAMVDGHKHTAGKRVLIYGDTDLVYALTHFAQEIGLQVAVCATGSKSGFLSEAIDAVDGSIDVMDGADFTDITEAAQEHDIELIIGNSKGYKTARALDIPLIRTGFPVHDRMGGQRLLHVGYEGATALYDNIVNSLIAYKQNKSSFGYTYQ